MGAKPKVAVMGTTAWGTTLALMLARRDFPAFLWARTQEEAAALQKERENKARLPGFPFPPGLVVTPSLEEALAQAEMVILAVPSQTMRANARLLKGHLKEPLLVLSAAKGLELETALRMSQVLSEELHSPFLPYLCVLSGPNLSREIAQGLPASSVVAAEREGTARRAQEILMSPLFRVYTNTDVIGVEMGGALKNIIALGAGMADGLGYGDNAKAAFMTRGLAEITRLGVAAGANPLTFAGLAGLGDLVATCASPLSRNRYVGLELAKGRNLKDIVSGMKSVAEGITTTVVARQMAEEMRVEMPITEQVYRVLFEGVHPRQAVAELMGRAPRPELSGLQ